MSSQPSSSPPSRSIALQSDPPMNIFGVNYTGDGFQLGDRMIPTPIALRRAIKDQLQSGMRFDFGIYPGAIRVETGLPHINGTVTAIEESRVRLEVPSTGGTIALLMEIKTTDDGTAIVPAIGTVLPLAFDLKQMFLFDGSGDRIYPPIELQ